ncbi:hypothetical protein NLJ89_g3558 [Agrocybe chaxingu]|uniref:Uncharacterized protein n=1 Tax=Agrocybe chaxingu TaxID=84603 RepID=A0A9W8MWS1_9AGAR|nr:hypothetical protein NLJ89_g3558 [Agrocybe chaxingu]
MAPKRGQPSNARQESLNVNGQSSPVQPRSTSPSSGFTQFLTRPSKWFSRSVSASKVSPSPSEERPSIGSGGRKHKISRPTDPRPILDAYQAGGASRSVLDLSVRQQGSIEVSRFPPPSVPSSPTVGHSLSGLGDLRAISRKGWSRSADDLSRISPAEFSPVKPSFQERIAEYRSRSDSNPSIVSPASQSPISSSHPINGRHPFPSAGPSSPSSSPPRSATLPTVSISISSPALDEGLAPRTTSPTPAHTRSHSFTPKLPSKLAVPRIAQSPQRERSHDRELDVRDLDRPMLGTPTRAAFGFGFSVLPPNKMMLDTSPAPSPTNYRSTTLLPPPLITEPKGGPDHELADLKRSSQIVFNSGFINRLADAQTNFHHANLPLSKGWKPYKLELKGSKLYFYKPPNDRAAEIKELFPTSLVPPSEQDDDDFNAETPVADDMDGMGRSKKGKGREESQAGVVGRKKRAYWGRRTHPDLIRDASTGAVEKGTLEALVHEAAFATTFFCPPNEGEPEDRDAQRLRWHEFASSVIFSLPSIVGQQAFEVEFLRCCSNLVNGAEDGVREEERLRVVWLANEYLRYHDRPADTSAWEEWKKETIPDADLSAGVPMLASSGLPSSSSMQAILQSSPSAATGSPNINTFSPRPDDNSSKMIPLLDALFPIQFLNPETRGYDRQQPVRPGTGLTPPGSRFPWAALYEEGLTRDILFCIDPYLLSKSLMLFHRSILEQCPENVTAESMAASDAQQTYDDQGLLSPESALIHLFGSDDHPHWLTKLLLLQILGTDNSVSHHYNTSSPNQLALASPGRKSEERGGSGLPQTSRTHSRSEVISVWAKVGELCRTSGDECSWQAIAAALCSRPVARLDKVWKRVDPNALAAVESWVHVPESGQGKQATVSEPRVTPWGGDVKARLGEELGKAKGENDSMVQMEPISKARVLFEQFRTSFVLCPRKVCVPENEISEDLRRMARFWRNLAAEGGATSGIAVKFKRVDQFMSLSLAAEPRRKGLFEPYFWSRSASSHSPYTSLVPLLFPDPLPSLTLVDRSKLIRSRIDSDASDLQYLRSLDAQLRADAARQLHGFDQNQDFTKRLILGNGGTVIPVHNGDLLLVVQSGGFESTPESRPSSQMPSRPPSSVTEQGEQRTVSRNPSIRVKPGTSKGLDRKTSVARRSSLPSVSHLSRSNFVIAEPSLDPPLRVIVQAGTLNNLVNILVHGLEKISVSVADDNGEMSLREGMMRELMLDRMEFARVWWNVFRSFVTPFVFFELLRKIYITAQPPGSLPTSTDYLDAINNRAEVLATVKEWLTLGGGAQDILDDNQLFIAVQSFLESPADHQLFKAPASEADSVKQAWESLSEMRQWLSTVFISQMRRPTISRGLHPRPSTGPRSARKRNISTRDPPDLDHMDPEDFVDNLDGMASAAFSNVTQEDLYITADLLEVQTQDRTGWFSARDVPTSEELVEIQTIYSHIQDVEPSSLISELSQDALYRLLPPGIRSCIRAYTIIRKWLISKLVAPRIGLRARQARMELLVQVIEVARLRNTETPSAAQLIEQPCVRSFVEAVATSALLSVESRLHHRAWQSIAISRGCNCDSLSSLLLRPFVQTTSAQESLTIDIGWLLERMIEIIAAPDVIDSPSQDPQSLVNFDKRRHLCNLISKASCLPSARKIPSEEAHRRGFERLNSIEKEVMALQFDLRGVKEEAIREATTSSMNGATPSKKPVRPFSKIVAIQVEKHRRDKNMRTRAQREKMQEQNKNDRRDDLLNKAMRPRKPLSNAQKQHRNKKSMSVFLSFMRPLSTAFGAEIPHHVTHKRSPSELDFSTTGKPSLVLSILDAQVSQFINNERSFMFKLDTEDGGHYLLQAISKREMNKWLETISRVTKSAAKRRLTYLGNPKPQIADHIHSHAIVASRDPKAVFGVELEFLLRREAGGDEIPPGTVPLIIEQCLAEIESRGLSEVGIYRIAGATTEINALKDAYNRGECPIRPTTDIHAICDLVKSWFRVLPQPVFPPDSYRDVMQAMRQENLDDRLVSIRNVVQALPQANFDILRRVSEHLDRVTDYEEHNQMTAEALAIVFSPNLLRAPQNDFVMILNNMGLSHKLVKALITHFHVIFDEADPEAELHSEDELDSPILEEDEEEEEDASHDSIHDSHDNQPLLNNGSQYTPP